MEMTRDLVWGWNIFKGRASSRRADDLVAFSETEPRTGCLALAANPSGLQSLYNVLDVIEHFQCEDERDKLCETL
jgi:hypothetical protein